MKAKTSPEQKGKKQETKGVQPRNRIKYSKYQLHRLEKAFYSTQYPDSAVLDELSNTLTVSVERLSVWFQNRRSKFKRQSKDKHVGWMRQQLYHAAGSPHNDSRSSQSPPDTKHVLSPPSQDKPMTSPSSNIHYMPNVGSPPETPVIPGYYNYHVTSPPLSSDSNHGYPAIHNTSPNNQVYPTNDSTSPINNNAYSTTESNPVIINSSPTSDTYGHVHTPRYESDYQHGYYPASGYYGHVQYPTSAEAYYQSYAPHYSFPSSQMNFPQIGV